MRISTPRTLLSIGIVSFGAAAGGIGYQLGKTSLFSASPRLKINGDLAVNQLARIAWSAPGVEDGETHPRYWRDWTLDFRASDGMVSGAATPAEQGTIFDALWPLSRQVMQGSGNDQPQVFSFIIAMTQ